MRGIRSDGARVRLLQNTSLLGGLNLETIQFILERAGVTKVPQGAFFFHERDDGVSTFLLEEGRAEVLRHWGGTNHRLRELVKGDCFGEVALIDFGPRSASVRALEDCRATELTPAILRELQARDLEQFTLIYMNMGRELSRRLRAADERIFRAKMEPRTVIEIDDGEPFI